MQVDTMRFIDRYAGVPLCFLGTIFQRIFLRPRKGVAPKKILFAELSEMGSAIIADPAMRKASELFGAELFFVIFKKNKPSLELLKTIPEDNIFSINADSISGLVKDTFRFLKWARKRKIDTVVDLELFSRYTALLSGFCGADNIVGFYNFHGEGLYRGRMMTREVFYNPHIHMSKNFMAMINSLSEEPGTLPFSKTIIRDSDIVLAKCLINKETAEKIAEKIKASYLPYHNGTRILLINPNASDLLPQRRWSREGYAEVIKMALERYPGLLVLITGGTSEKEGAQALADMVGDERCINFAGSSKLSELPALYSLSSLMISNDSGPAHFAAVTDMPTIVIFGPETPKLYASLGDSTPIYAGLACSPCVSAANHRKTPCRDNTCLKLITPERVFEEVTKRLG